MTANGAPSISNPNYRWHVLLIVMIGTLMAALDSSIVNVSIPAIMADFGAAVDDIEWVVTGYMLAFATLMPLTGWFRERIGHKNLYIGSLIVFTVGSVLCGMAWNLPSLIVARVIQALGGGAVTPTGMAMITEVFPPKERGKAMGYWGLGVIIGPAIGPTLGGILTKQFGWRSIFMINLPIGILGTLLAMRLLAPDRPTHGRHRPFDIPGFTFLSCFLISFLLALSKGEHEGWTSAYIVTCALTSFFSLIAFLVVEPQIEHPIMDLSLFKSPVFSVCMLVTFVRSIALFGGVFLLPLFLQQQMGLDEVQSGLILLPGSLVLALLMPIAGKLADHIGPRYLAIVGLLGIALFMFDYRVLDVQMSVWDVINPTLIRGFGMGLLMAPVMATAMNAVATRQAGMASSMLNLIQQVGGSVGIAALATILSHRIRFHLAVLGQSMDAAASAFRIAGRNVFQHALSLGYSHSQASTVAKSLIAKKVVQAAAVHGFEDAFLSGAVMVMVAVIPAFLLPTKTTGHAGPEAMME